MKTSNHLKIAAVVVFIFGCGSGNDNRDDPDSGTNADTDSDTDTNTDSDADSDTDSDDNDDDDDYCDDVEFPPSNGPDGCERILLTKTPEGVPFSNSATWDVAISRDGSLAAFGVFYSDDEGDSLPEDTNGKDDVYAVDLNTMEMEIVSVSGTGELGNGSSYAPSVSADGRYVAFGSSAIHLDDENVNYAGGIFVRDRLEGKTELVSVSFDGSPANNDSDNPIISGDGRYVVFFSRASNLVEGDTNEESDLFLRDRIAQTTERLTVNEEGEETFGNGLSTDFNPANISDDGRYVLFMTWARLSDQDDDPDTEPELDVYLRDRETGRNLMPTAAPDGYRFAESVALSPDGSRVLFSTGEPNHYQEVDGDELDTSIFLAVRVEDDFTFEPVLRNGGYYGDIGLYGMSADYRNIVGRCGEDYVDYMGKRPSGYSIANVCVLDRDSGEMTLVTAAEDGTPGVIPHYDDGTQMIDFVTAAISGDGKRIVFSTIQYGIVDDDMRCLWTRHIYLRDCP